MLDTRTTLQRDKMAAWLWVMDEDSQPGWFVLKLEKRYNLLFVLWYLSFGDENKRAVWQTNWHGVCI